jgi:TonB-dependent starch-binding outer membrane protein SusC
MRKILFVAMLCWPVMAMAQTAKIDRCWCSLEEILKDFKSQTTIRYYGKKNILDSALPVCFNKFKGNVEAFIQKLHYYNPDIEVRFNDNVLTIVKRPNNTDVNPGKPVSNFPKTLTGFVYNEDGQPLEGACITIKGQTDITNALGYFELPVKPNDTLLISMGGYEHAQFYWRDESSVTIRLRQINPVLVATVVRGYLKHERPITGSSVTLKDTNLPSGNIENKLRSSGLLVTQLSGIAGGSSHIAIRGTNSIGLTAGSTPSDDPLIVVNGIPLSTFNQPLNQQESIGGDPGAPGRLSTGLSPLFAIDPADIESITILKDAVATAIYGSRGANGVIVIITKKARVMKPTVQVSANFGISWATRILRTMNISEYVKMRTDAAINAGFTPLADYLPDLYLWDTTRNKNYGKYILGKTGLINGQQVSFSQGDSLTQMVFAASNYRETSILSRDITTQRFTLMADINCRTRNNKFQFNLSAYRSQVAANWITGALLHGQFAPPHLPDLVDNAGNLQWSSNGLSFNNFLGYLQNAYDIKTINNLLHGSVQYKLNKTFKLQASLGYQHLDTYENSIIPISGQDPAGIRFGSAFVGRNSYRLATPELQLHATHSWKDFHGDILFGASALFQQNERSRQNLDGYKSDSSLGNPALALENNFVYDDPKYRFLSLFGRAEFNYQNRYFLDFILRLDGSSRFAPENRYALFPAAGAAVVLYKGYSDSAKSKIISRIKIRSSFGLTGNDQIGDYAYLNAWYRQAASPGNPGNTGISPARLYNRGYKWQQTAKFEAALEVGLFNNKVNLTAAYFRNRTTDQLINQLLPSQTGFTSIVTNFPAVVQNAGFEGDLRATLGNKRFSYTGTANFSIIKNKLVKFPGLENTPYADALVIGQSLTVQRGFPHGGVDPASGRYTITDSLKRIAGNKDATFFGSLHQSFTFMDKFNIEFLFDWRISKAFHFATEIYDHLPPGLLNEAMNTNQPREFINRWLSPGDLKPWQMVSADPGDNINKSIKYWTQSTAPLINNSFFRFRFVRLGYNIAGGIPKWHIKNINVYVEGQNLLTITPYPGLDPEIPHVFRLPPTANVSAGFTFSF